MSELKELATLQERLKKHDPGIYPQKRQRNERPRMRFENDYHMNPGKPQQQIPFDWSFLKLGLYGAALFFIYLYVLPPSLQEFVNSFGHFLKMHYLSF
jgi:hypothetical protein